MKWDIKGLKSVNWRIVTGMLCFGVWMALYYLGRNWDYWNSFIFQACVVATASYFFGMFWSKSSRKPSRQEDSVFFPGLMSDYIKAAEYAHTKMKERGYVYSKVKATNKYVRRWRDCGKFVHPMIGLMQDWFYAEFPDQEAEQGLGIEMCSYTKDNGDGHICVECRVWNEQEIHFDVYPDFPLLLNLSKKELKTREWRNW